MNKFEKYPLKIINEMIFTDKAVKILNEEYKINIHELSDNELRTILNKEVHDEKIMIADNGEAVWAKEDMELICFTIKRGFFYKVEELEFYVGHYPSDDMYHIYGIFGDTFKFLRLYLEVMDYNPYDEKLFNRIFEDNLKNIYWYNKDNELKEAVDKQLEKVKNDILEDELLIFQGKTFDSLKEQIEILVGSKEEYEFMTLSYYGKRVCRIKDKLYYLSNDSGRDDRFYYWILREFGRKGYEYFRNR